VGVAYYEVLGLACGWSMEGCRTFLEPLIQAGFLIFARNGILPTLVVRDTQPSGVLVNVRSDMCVRCAR
jgi:hypothetical protein